MVRGFNQLTIIMSQSVKVFIVTFKRVIKHHNDTVKVNLKKTVLTHY